MPQTSVRGSSRRLAARIQRWALILIALVFVLNVADPTPRFLGLQRVKNRLFPTHTETADPVLAEFALPAAITPRDGATDAPTLIDALGLAPCAIPSVFLASLLVHHAAPDPTVPSLPPRAGVGLILRL